MANAASGTSVTADEALQRLLDGNERFRRGESQWAGLYPHRLAALADGQHPFATVLGCSDSRVPPELIFDAGLGELFVIRVAGNVMTEGVVGSLQYAGSHLDTPLVIVLGHDECGAVQAALATKFRGERHTSRITVLVDNILAGLNAIDANATPASQLTQAIDQNVRWSMRQVAELPEARARLADGRMKVVGGIYEMASGRVRFL